MRWGPAGTFPGKGESQGRHPDLIGRSQLGGSACRECFQRRREGPRLGNRVLREKVACPLSELASHWGPTAALEPMRVYGQSPRAPQTSVPTVSRGQKAP